MNESRERLFWVIALTLSITAHAAFVLLMPGAAVKPEIKPIMRVRLAMADKKSAPVPVPVPIRKEAPAEKKAVPKKEAVTKKLPQKKAEPAKAVKTPPEKAPCRKFMQLPDRRQRGWDSVNATNDAALTDNSPASPPQARPERVIELDSLES
jgi:hypothetical protein